MRLPRCVGIPRCVDKVRMGDAVKSPILSLACHRWVEGLRNCKRGMDVYIRVQGNSENVDPYEIGNER